MPHLWLVTLLVALPKMQLNRLLLEKVMDTREDVHQRYRRKRLDAL
jgi:hypothetical protein